MKHERSRKHVPDPIRNIVDKFAIAIHERCMADRAFSDAVMNSVRIGDASASELKGRIYYTDGRKISIYHIDIHGVQRKIGER